MSNLTLSPAAKALEWDRPRRCAIDQDEPGSVLDVVAPALERASALADELAQLLVPARLFT